MKSDVPVIKYPAAVAKCLQAATWLVARRNKMQKNKLSVKRTKAYDCDTA